MSLLNTASVWQNDHDSSSSVTTKKRTPTMNRRPPRPKPYVNEYGPEEYQKEENTSLLGNVIPAGTGGSIMEDQRRNNERSEKVHAMLDQLNQVNTDNDGNRLADFTPLAPPQVQQKNHCSHQPVPTGYLPCRILTIRIHPLPNREKRPRMYDILARMIPTYPSLAIIVMHTIITKSQ